MNTEGEDKVKAEDSAQAEVEQTPEANAEIERKMYSNYYRRDGTQYPTSREGFFQWGKDFENRDLKIVAKTTLWNGFHVSTVWLGIDHNFGHGKPLIFESMVFDWKFHEADVWRYSSEHHAMRGHKFLVKRWSSYEFFTIQTHRFIRRMKDQARWKLDSISKKIRDLIKRPHRDDDSA